MQTKQHDEYNKHEVRLLRFEDRRITIIFLYLDEKIVSELKCCVTTDPNYMENIVAI